MSIQEKIRIMLDQAIKNLSDRKEIDSIKNRGDRKEINNLKFLFAETQRGKMKEMDDKEVINIFVSLIRKQREMQLKLDIASDEYHDADDFIGVICSFLDPSIVDQVFIMDIQIIDWIERNVDMSKVKNPNMLIGVVKKAMPYVDGNLIKDSIALMQAPLLAHIAKV